MRRNRELQLKMLKHLRGDGVDYKTEGYSEEEMKYNAGLLVDEGIVEGICRKNHTGIGYSYVSIRGLNNASHDLLEELEQKTSALLTSSRHEFQMAIFISHSSADKELASRLASLFRLALTLPADQIRCTSVDGYRLPVGANTDDQLRREVRESRVLVGLVTHSSITSPYVLFELGARWGAKLPLFPVLGYGADNSLLRGPLGGINALNLQVRSQVHQLLEDIARELDIELAQPSAIAADLESVIVAAQPPVHELQSVRSGL